MVWAWMPLAWLRKHVVGLGSLKNQLLNALYPYIHIYIHIHMYTHDVRFHYIPFGIRCLTEGSKYPIDMVVLVIMIECLGK